MEAGADSYLRKDMLTQEPARTPPSRRCAVARRSSTPRHVMAAVARGVRSPGPAAARRRPSPGPVHGARLTEREQRVLALIADGHPTREVALELSYSERTVKNILHDVVTKLNARSRSQAVAHAVRDGLI